MDAAKGILIFLICSLPTLTHLWNDRNGDRRKTNDLIALTILSLALAGVLKWAFDTDLLRSLLLMFGVHFLVFDYAIVWILRRKGVIRKSASVFRYTGKSSKVDRVVSRVNPWVRLAIRAVVFSICFTVSYRLLAE